MVGQTILAPQKPVYLNVAEAEVSFSGMVAVQDVAFAKRVDTFSVRLAFLR
jgi:hypothetical protein